MELSIIIILGSILSFIFLWFFILFLISFFGGWNRTSILHSDKKTFLKNRIEKQYSSQSLYFNTSNKYKNCIHITIYSTGIEMKPMWIFSLFHKPIYILWDEITNFSNANWMFLPGVTIKTNKNVTFTILGDSAEEIENIFSKNNSFL